MYQNVGARTTPRNHFKMLEIIRTCFCAIPLTFISYLIVKLGVETELLMLSENCLQLSFFSESIIP